MVKVKIYVIHLREDDPSKCTAEKMIRHGYAIRVRRPPPHTILLDPTVETPLTSSDRVYVERGGVTVVDASWRKTSNLNTVFRRLKGVKRRLPLLFAANPQHYAWLYKLSSLEAVAAALYITGYKDQALKLLSLYKWGENFIELNRELLESYSRATTPDEILTIESKLLSRILGVEVEPSRVQGIIARLVASDYYKD